MQCSLGTRNVLSRTGTAVAGTMQNYGSGF